MKLMHIRRCALLIVAVLFASAIAVSAQTPAPITPVAVFQKTATPAPVTPGLPVAPVFTPEVIAPPVDDARLASCVAPSVSSFLPVTLLPGINLAGILAGSPDFTPAQIAAFNCLDDSAASSVLGTIWIPATAFAAGGGIQLPAPSARPMPVPPHSIALTVSVEDGSIVQNQTGLTVDWNSDDDYVTLALCPAITGELQDSGCISPQPAGDLPFPAQGRLTLAYFWTPGDYALVVTSLAGDLHETTRAAFGFTVECSNDSLAPSVDALCPDSPPLATSGAVQSFERGKMIWFADTQQILVLREDGTAQFVTDTFQEGMPDPLAAAPEGLLAPVRGFGRVWDWLGGADDSGLGWATALETGMSIFRQPAGRSSYITYYSMPDAPEGSFAFALTQAPGQSTAYWTPIPPATS